MSDICVIWVCTNCIMHLANGECGDCHGDGHEYEPLNKVTWVTWGSDYIDHSTWPCEGCGSPFHGERHEATLWIY